MVTGIGTMQPGIGNMMVNTHQTTEPIKKPDNRRVSALWYT